MDVMGIRIRARSVFRYSLSQIVRRIRKRVKEQPVARKGGPKFLYKYKFHYLRRAVSNMELLESIIEKAPNEEAKKKA